MAVRQVATGVRWRCLDGLAWALAWELCILYVPAIGRSPLGHLRLLYVIPLLFAAALVFRLGTPRELAGTWLLWRLRASWLAVAGLSPFPGWWSRCSEARYLALGAALALSAAPWALLETVAVPAALAKARRRMALYHDAVLARAALLYLFLIPVAALLVTFAIAFLQGMATVPGDWLHFWRLIPPWGRLLMALSPLLAAANLARMLLRMSPDLAQSDPAQAHENDAGGNDV
ncbi:MAG: hypothetical protein JXR77_14140 [Lentisphaeria bacterium]|nr:hypothetical protein [Lentisphaeria bacterium]